MEINAYPLQDQTEPWRVSIRSMGNDSQRDLTTFINQQISVIKIIKLSNIEGNFKNEKIFIIKNSFYYNYTIPNGVYSSL